MWTKQDGTLQPLLVDEDILLRRLADLVEEVGSDDSSNEESGMHADLFSVSGSDSD